MPSILSNSDLELLYLQTLAGATGNNLTDCRNQIYGVNEWAYFSARSGLAPASLYSLADHKYAYYLNAATAWVEKRRNLAFTPRPGAGLNGWAAPGPDFTVAAGSDGAFPSGSYARGTDVNPVIATSGFVYHSFIGENLVPGSTQVCFSIYSRTSATRALVPRLFERNDAAVTAAVDTSTASQNSNAGAVTRLSYTFITRPDTVSLSLGVMGASGGPNWATGDTFDASSVLLELGSSVGTYFDGSTAAGSLERYRWLGTFDDSQSVYETRLSDVASSGTIADAQRRFWLLSLGL